MILFYFLYSCFTRRICRSRWRPTIRLSRILPVFTSYSIPF